MSIFLSSKSPPKLRKLTNSVFNRSMGNMPFFNNAEYVDILKGYTAFKSPSVNGFSWLTTDDTLLSLMQTHFKPIIDTFDLTAKPQINPPSSVVEIVPIQHTAFNKDIFFKQIPHESVCIGGPSALVMSYFEAKRYAKKDSMLLPPLFATHSVNHSNAYGSALQIHQRYAQRMAYTDSKYEGWNLLRIGIQRLCSQRTLEEALLHDYLPVDFDWQAILKNDPLEIANICLKNELLTWKDKLNRWLDKKTTGSRTYHHAKESARLLKAIDAELGGIFTQDGALSIGLSQKEYLAIQRKNTWLARRYQINSEPISTEELKRKYQLAPDFSLGGGAFFYPEDGYLRYDFWDKIITGILKNRGIVESWLLKKIVIGGYPEKVLGVIVEENHEERFIRTEHVYTSLGYNARYQFKTMKTPSSFLRSDAIEPVTTGTGFSGFAIVFGHMPTVPIAFNSHHTTLLGRATDLLYGELSLVKTTGGTLIGSNNQYQVQHSINNLWYNTHIFGENRFRLIAAKACSRSINSVNSGQFASFPGWVVGTGRGGKGVTDMVADAIVAGELLRKTEPPYRKHTLDMTTLQKQAHAFWPGSSPHSAYKGESSYLSSKNQHTLG